MNVELGQGPSGPVHLNVDALVGSRLLLQANSGSGKSWALRRILEQTHGHLQHLVLDREGEFYTLRERFDYVLAGRDGGDCPVEPRSAKLLARRLLELGTSAILDLYEMQTHDRIAFVRRFLEALLEAPRSLWHPVLVVVDEAHQFCPQRGNAESAGAVVELMSRGRKRGFCGLLATQRISKLHKDAAAEANNYLIGRAALDVDTKRAAEELGFSGREEQQALRRLKPGEFWAFGTALCDEVTLCKVGQVVTTHPKAGAKAARPAAPRERIQAVLAQLADLPREAEEEARTVEELGRKLRAAEAEIRRLEKAGGGAIQEEIGRARAAGAREAEGRLRSLVAQIQARDGRAAAALERARLELGSAADAVREPIDVELRAAEKETPRRRQMPAPRPAATVAPSSAASSLGKGERATLIAAAQHGAVTRPQLTILTGYKRSSRDTYLQKLRAAGFVEIDGSEIRPTPEGVAALGSDFERLPVGPELRAHWLSMLPAGEAKVLSMVVEAYPEAVDRSEITAVTGYARSSRDTYLQRLAARQLVTTDRGGVRAADQLF